MYAQSKPRDISEFILYIYIGGKLRSRSSHTVTRAPEFPPTLKRQILLQLKELAMEVEALAAEIRHLAKLAGSDSKNWMQKSSLSDWPCDFLPNLIRVFESSERVPLLDLRQFFRNMAVIAHLQAGRDMRAEITACFKGVIPFGFVVLAVETGRVGVLRPFGIRPGRNDVTLEDLTYVGRLLEIANQAHRVLVDALASSGTAWPCPKLWHAHDKDGRRVLQSRLRENGRKTNEAPQIEGRQ